MSELLPLAPFGAGVVQDVKKVLDLDQKIADEAAKLVHLKPLPRPQGTLKDWARFGLTHVGQALQATGKLYGLQVRDLNVAELVEKYLSGPDGLLSRRPELRGKIKQVGVGTYAVGISWESGQPVFGSPNPGFERVMRDRRWLDRPLWLERLCLEHLARAAFVRVETKEAVCGKHFFYDFYIETCVDGMALLRESLKAWEIAAQVPGFVETLSVLAFFAYGGAALRHAGGVLVEPEHWRMPLLVARNVFAIATKFPGAVVASHISPIKLVALYMIIFGDSKAVEYVGWGLRQSFDVFFVSQLILKNFFWTGTYVLKELARFNPVMGDFPNIHVPHFLEEMVRYMKVAFTKVSEWISVKVIHGEPQTAVVLESEVVKRAQREAFAEKQWVGRMFGLRMLS